MKAGRVLGVDPGEKRIGAAISDESASLARPLTVIKCATRQEDAQEIVRLAQTNQAVKIVIGQSLDEDGKPTYQGRRSRRLAGVISEVCDLEIVLWDESFSTREALRIRTEMGVQRKKRSGHVDEAAASVMLQSYLDATHKPGE